MAKQRLLITDTAPLYPPLWGGPRRIWNLFSNFDAELFDIKYVGVDFSLNQKDRKYSFKKIGPNFSEISSGMPAHYYVWHAFEKLVFRNTSLDLFLYLWMHTDRQFKYLLNAQKPDVVVFSHPWSSLCIPKQDKQFFIYDAHNCEYLLMKKVLGRHIFRDIVLRQVKKIESDACSKSDLVLVCSENEKNDLLDLYTLTPDKIIVTTNGSEVKVPTDQVKKEDSRLALGLEMKEKVVVFIGAYYKPNIDAARFIMEGLAPEMPDFTFLLVGAISCAFSAAEIPANVRMTGSVSEEKLEQSLRASDLAINPMFDGSGTNIKMLDYMAYGLPIITTQIGARGIATFGKRPMRVVPAGNFYAEIKKLSDDQEVLQQMAQEGQCLVAEHYDWKAISKGLEHAIVERLKHRG